MVGIGYALKGDIKKQDISKNRSQELMLDDFIILVNLQTKYIVLQNCLFDISLPRMVYVQILSVTC